MDSMRERFVNVANELVETDPRVAVVLADISAKLFADAMRRHPERVVNVGIREQLMVGVAGGLALTGLRPYVHTYAPFLIERAFEQVKLDLGHQGVGAVLVSVGASYDWAAGGRTHHAPEDVALIDTLSGWTIDVPGHPDEAELALRAAANGADRVYVRLSDQHNAAAHAPSDGGFTVLKRGAGATVIAIGPMLDRVLAATAGLDVTVLYGARVRPFDSAALRSVLTKPEVVLVEPYLAGTSTRVVADTLVGVAHRVLALGVPASELRRYGTADQHDRAYGLDPQSLRAQITDFIGAAALRAAG